MNIRMFKSIVIILFSIVLLAGCAGSREEGDDYLSEDEKQQKELDDIEALLGISSEGDDQQKAEAEPVTKTDDSQQNEKLDLLGTDEMIDNTQPEAMNSAEAKKLEDKIKRLEDQVRTKDRTIADLNAQLSVQEAELKDRPKFSQGTSNIVGDISMEEYQSRYDEARAEFEARNYQAAIQLFESLLAVSSSHSLSDNAQFWIGESHYALRQYDAAIIDFEKVFTFTNSNKADASQFKLGLCYMRKGESEKAREELDRLIRNYPNSVYASKAEKLLSKI